MQDSYIGSNADGRTSNLKNILVFILHHIIFLANIRTIGYWILIIFMYFHILNVFIAVMLKVTGIYELYIYIYRMILSVLDPSKCEYLKDYSLDFEHAYMTTYLVS